MVQYLVLKKEPENIFFKTSHLSELFMDITLPRTAENPKTKPRTLNPLSPKKPMLPKDKFDDLMSLCPGETPGVSSQEHVVFTSVYHMPKSCKRQHIILTVIIVISKHSLTEKLLSFTKTLLL